MRAVGDPRRPPVRSRRRQIPDGIDDAAALMQRGTAQRTQPKGPPEGSIGRGGRSTLSRGDLGLVPSGRLGFATVFCVVFPVLPLFRSSFLFSAGAGDSG